MSNASLMTSAKTMHQTTKSRCRIFHVGLDARETLVIESMFRMNPELGQRFVFGAPTDSDPADVMFVNGDSDEAMAEWRRISHAHPECTPILTCTDDSDFGAVRTVRKPLAFRNFTAILDAITSTEGAYFANTDATVDQLRILVVDDSFPARRFMQLKLEELAGSAIKIEVDMADCGEKAIQCAHDRAYDLIFLDVIMPGIDGYETCRLIKAIQPRVRIAILTGKTSPIDFTRGREAGCDNYMTKPPNDIDLRTIVRLTSLKKMTAAH